MGKEDKNKDHHVYAELMSNNSEGRFLFNPQSSSELRSGSVGFFLKTGDWNEITNILDQARLQQDGYTPFPHVLKMREPESDTWVLKCSESVKGRNMRAEGGVSGAGAGVPVDVSAKAKRSKSSTGKAALITPSEVVQERFTGAFISQIKDWVLENADVFLKSGYGEQIKERGLWAVQATWATKECAVKLTSGESQEIDLGLDLAAGGIGKLGLGGGWSETLKTANWRVRTGNEKAKSWVVSFAGALFEPTSFSRLWAPGLKHVKQTISLPPPSIRLIREKNGGVIGVELVRITKVVDKDLDFDVLGMSESDIEAEKEWKQQRAERKSMLERKLMGVAKIEDEEKKKAELKTILEDNADAVNLLLSRKIE